MEFSPQTPQYSIVGIHYHAPSLATPVYICYPEILSIANKYNIQCLDVSVGQVRRCVWETFADSVM